MEQATTRAQQIVIVFRNFLKFVLQLDNKQGQKTEGEIQSDISTVESIPDPLLLAKAIDITSKYGAGLVSGDEKTVMMVISDLSTEASATTLVQRVAKLLEFIKAPENIEYKIKLLKYFSLIAQLCTF